MYGTSMDSKMFFDDVSALSTIYGIQESDRQITTSYLRFNYLMESGASSDILMEGAHDVINSIVAGIAKVIEAIKNFFKKVLLYITSLFKDLDKLAKDVKPIVDKMDKIDFTIDGFNFTVLDKKGPDMTEFQSIVSEYNSDMEDLKSLKKVELKEKYTNWSSVRNQEQLRGKVLGNGKGIDEDDFLEEVRSYYRGGEESSTTITVDKRMVNSIIDHATELEKAKKESIKDRDKICTLLTKTKAFFDRTIRPAYIGNTKSVDLRVANVDDNKFSSTANETVVQDTDIVTIYATLKSKQVNWISSVINTVASERVNALKDQVKQERTILRQCLFGGSSSSSDTSVAASESALMPNFESVTGWDDSINDIFSYTT